MTHEHTTRDRLTVEAALWILVVALALVLRLAQLGRAPLTAAEARETTLAWRAATGQGLPSAHYNPCLLAANALLFSLFGASDFLARLLPALFGALLALTPLFFKQHLGRIAALAAGLYLAISPTALIASRQLTGGAIAVTSTVACVGGLTRFIKTKRRGWLTFAAVGLALALASGSTAYALLPALALAWVVVSQPWLDKQPSGIGLRVLFLRPHASNFFVALALALVAICTGLGWNLSGIGAVGDSLVAWIARFRPTASPSASPFTLLVVYELFVLTFGIGGLVAGLQRGERLPALLGLWAGTELLLLTLMPGRTPTDLLWAVLPLALLTGLSLEGLVRDRSSSDGALRTAYAVLVLVVWAYGYLMLGRYAALADRADLALMVIALVVQALLALSFGLALGSRATLRTAAEATGVALLCLTLSAAWGVAYGHPADPREALVRDATAFGVRDLVQTLRDLSWQRTGLPSAVEFAFEAPADSVLAWYLREFDMGDRVNQLLDVNRAEDSEVLVTMGDKEEAIAKLGGEYAGQTFVVRRQWAPRDPGCRFWDSGCNVVFGWFLFRDAPSLPEPVDWATLWTRIDTVD